MAFIGHEAIQNYQVTPTTGGDVNQEDLSPSPLVRVKTNLNKNMNQSIS